MLSDNENGRQPLRTSRWAWLWSQELGIFCGLSTVALLAIGSIVLSATREGVSARVRMDDVRVFFEEPSPVHFWFYLLVVVLALYALNTLLATWKSVTSKWRVGVRAPRLYAASVIHAAFLFGLLAHLVGGLGGAELGVRVIGPEWTALGDGREARVTRVDVDRHADGSTRQERATLEMRGAGRESERAVVHYNGPLSAGLGSELFLLVRSGALPVARLVRGADHCVLGEDGRGQLGDLAVSVLHLQSGAGPHGNMARVQVQSGAAAGQSLWLFEGRPQTLADGTVLILAAVEARPAVMLRRRHAPGNPWALLASLLLLAGLLLMWRRFLPAAPVSSSSGACRGAPREETTRG